MAPSNAEGVPGVTAVLTVAGLTGIQIERFIEHETVTSINHLKAYANHDTVAALVLALASVRLIGHHVRILQRLIEDIVVLGTWVKDMHRRNRTQQSADWDMFAEEEYKQEVAIRCQATDLDLKPPKQCPADNTSEWRPWKRQTEKDVESVRGVDGIALNYVICLMHLPPGYTSPTTPNGASTRCSLLDQNLRWITERSGKLSRSLSRAPMPGLGLRSSTRQRMAGEPGWPSARIMMALVRQKSSRLSLGETSMN